MKKSLLCFSLVLFALSPISISASAEDTLSISYARELAAQGRYDEALDLYEKIRETNDSIFYTEYDQTVSALYKENQIDEQEFENKRTVSRILLTVIVLALILILVFYITYKTLKNRTIKLQKSREELGQARRLAEISVKNKSTALSNMSHEIKTPLNSIVGFSSLLAEQDIDEETFKQCNEIIRLNSELLLKLINDVIDISCLDLNNMSFNLQNVDAVMLCREVAHTFENVQGASAEIVFESGFEEFEIETDPVRLQQMLYNLMSNAVKFCKEGRIVLSFSKANNKFVQFSVCDTGCGIPADKQKTIFERFERVEEMTPGTGIGLTICKLIIRRLGGSIWIDPKYTDGARFVFVHPIKQEVLR